MAGGDAVGGKPGPVNPLQQVVIAALDEEMDEPVADEGPVPVAEKDAIDPNSILGK
eukprot:gene4855-976_t